MFSSIHSFAPLLPEFLAGVGFLAGVALYRGYTHRPAQPTLKECNDSITMSAPKTRVDFGGCRPTKAREKEPKMIIVGCDYHPGFQQIANVDSETGEPQERRLRHREEGRGSTAIWRPEEPSAGGHGGQWTAHWFERLLAK